MFRYERKFMITDYSEYEIEEHIKSHHAFFRPIYQARHINNIYFDSLNFSAYHENVSGEEDREKTRIRWYGKNITDINKPKLEFKIKRGLLGTKKIYDLENFNLEEISPDFFNEKKISKDVSLKLKSLKPILLNRYKRKYYRSHDGNFRITVDTELSYYFLSFNKISLMKKQPDYGKIILELKYDKEHENKAQNISSKLPFKLTKNSKYLSGVHYMIN